MFFLYITFCIFISFIIFQTLYIIIPLFKNEDSYEVRIIKDYTFSIIVPAFNEEKVIEDCISGFKQLQYKNVELILVNDGSTDKTLEFLVNNTSVA